MNRPIVMRRSTRVVALLVGAAVLSGCASSPTAGGRYPGPSSGAPAYTAERWPAAATCSGRVVMKVLSIRRSDLGTVAMQVEYVNISNRDMRLAAYGGGANGHDTFLVDDHGEMWPMQIRRLGGGPNVEDKIFLPDLGTKATYLFRRVSGGRDATSFNLTNWVHLLSPTGTSLGGGFGGFCKLEIRDIPLAAS